MGRSLLRHVVLIPAALAGLVHAQTPPSPEVQRNVLRTVTEFARAYQERLPDFTCLRTTQHYLASGAGKEWRPQAKTAHELSYYRREEHYKLVSVDDVPRAKVPARSKSGGWIEMDGNFGWILRQLFDAKVHPHFEWSGWDNAQGKRALVFSYRIALAESHATSTTCGSWILFSTCKARVFGFHGRLFIDADSLDILRIEDIPDDLPVQYLQGKTSVDYARVTVAGAEYLLPVADRIETNSGKLLFRNDSTYTEYRKFVAESTLIVQDH